MNTYKRPRDQFTNVKNFTFSPSSENLNEFKVLLESDLENCVRLLKDRYGPIYLIHERILQGKQALELRLQNEGSESIEKEYADAGFDVRVVQEFYNTYLQIHKDKMFELLLLCLDKDVDNITILEKFLKPTEAASNKLIREASKFPFIFNSEGNQEISNEQISSVLDKCLSLIVDIEREDIITQICLWMFMKQNSLHELRQLKNAYLNDGTIGTTDNTSRFILRYLRREN